MIIIAAWLNNKSGIGHYTRAKKYFDFLKAKKKKVEIITFKNLNSLFTKIKNKKTNVILLDETLGIFVFSLLKIISETE